MQQLLLADNWQLKEHDPLLSLDDELKTTEGWISAKVPGSVHEALLAAGRIPDPFYGLNELDVQWVGERDWLYRCSFELPDDFSHEAAFLAFDGLDTIATVWLNGSELLRNDNMFVPLRVAVGSHLRSGKNTLAILFESALRVGKEREAEYGQRALWNGDSSRLYVRKAQYHYGWDWGPCLLTAGPWKAIRLESGARIADLFCPAEVAPDLARATLPVVITLEQVPSDASYELQLEIFAPDGAGIASTTIPVDAAELRYSFSITDPQLWWPHGYGAQPLYQVVATLRDAGDNVVDQYEERVGLRRLRVVQEPLDQLPGSSFYFEVNNTPIFCGGANWIPDDSFTTRITPERYRAQVQRAADANMVMLRVWGGGIYEDEAFFRACDEIGILVWQDFMFGCGVYPAHEGFRASVRAEARAQVRRLRNHPSLAIWVGNNEDYQIARSQGFYDPNFHGDFTQTDFPAREIYERLLPEVCAELDPQRLYWPGSPFAGDDPDDPTQGDRHAWEVWKGNDYHEYPQYVGRFVSEFGLAAAPNLRTIAEFAPPEERTASSRTFEFHNKATDGPRRLALYMSDNVPLASNLKEYVYTTQFVQAEALSLAYRSWRRHWGGPGRYACAGSLVWQLNDCWPVTSWAIVDSAFRPKGAYYAIHRELAPLSLGIAREAGQFAVWGVNGRLAAAEATLELRALTLDGQLITSEQRSVKLVPNAATEFGHFALPADAVIAGRLLVDGKVVARASSWPEPFKYLKLQDPELLIAPQGDEQVHLSVTRPVKGVWLDAGDGIAWSDNMLDLFPDDPQLITAAGLQGRAIEAQWLHAAE